MGCGASAGDKYKDGKASAATGGTQDATATKAQPPPASAPQPTKTTAAPVQAATAQEPPPEKPPEAAKPSGEVKAAPASTPAASAAPAATPAATSLPAVEEKPKDEEKAPRVVEPPEAEVGEACQAISPTAGTDVPVASENGGSLGADVVMAEAEAALAESDPPRDEARSDSHYLYEEDPEYPSYRGERMITASALLEVDRSSGASLGVWVRGAETVLLITKVEEEGLVAAWNSANAERIVRPGDRIIQVNGLCGAAETVLEELQKPIALRIEVDRTDREVKAALTNVGMAHWCREQIQKLYERNDEAGLKTLDRRMNTYKDRELALYRTLSKKFGEEPKDPELCYNSMEDIAL